MNRGTEWYECFIPYDLRVLYLCLLNNLTVLYAFIALSYSMYALIQYTCNISACLNEKGYLFTWCNRRLKQITKH